MLKIRAFRAPDDPVAGKEFAAGHRKVLEDLGVKVTTDNTDWINDPYVYVLVAEDTENDNQVVGGVRLHIANKHSEIPMVQAVGAVDPRVYAEIDSLMEEGVAEIAGIWNSRAVMGKGLGAIYLMRSVIAIASQIGLKTILSFASMATRQRGYDKGFEPLVSIGRSGEFNYPKLNLIATAVVCYDHYNLPLATELERNEIFVLRKKLNFQTVVAWPRGEFDLEYQLELKSVETIIEHV